MSCSLWSHGLQHSRLPCPSLSPGVCSNSSPLSRWCHPTISSSVTTFSSCPQSFSATGSFPVSQLFASGGQSIDVSALASVLPMNIQSWFPLGLTGLISLLSKRLKSLLQHHNSSFYFGRHSLLYGPKTDLKEYWVEIPVLLSHLTFLGIKQDNFHKVPGTQYGLNKYFFLPFFTFPSLPDK